MERPGRRRRRIQASAVDHTPAAAFAHGPSDRLIARADHLGGELHLRALPNLSYTARLMGLPFAERTRRIAAALARVRLSDVADKRVATF